MSATMNQKALDTTQTELDVEIHEEDWFGQEDTLTPTYKKMPAAALHNFLF
jgi:hypothetical protein